MDELKQLTDRLRVHVETLAATPRVPATAEHARARAYIVRHLQQAGFQTVIEESREEGQPCINVMTEARPPDAQRPLVVIGAHYDSIPESPGADDNASAVAALLELARWIGPKLMAGAHSARLQLVAYDLEEYGLLGSRRHARALRENGVGVRAMMSLEMLGFTDRRPGSQQLPVALRGRYPDVGDFIGVVGNEASLALLQTVSDSMKSVPELPVEYIAVPAAGRVLSETRLSDHSSFWDEGFHALMITDTSFFRNPHYHSATDTPATLDYDFLARVTMGVCHAAWRLLQSS